MGNAMLFRCSRVHLQDGAALRMVGAVVTTLPFRWGMWLPDQDSNLEPTG